MTVYQIKIDNSDEGISPSYGQAIERAYHAALDRGLISEISDFPPALLDSSFEGTEIDLMARALEDATCDHGIVIVKHDLDIEPTTSSDMGPAPYGRRNSISWALQQAIYDVGSGIDCKVARSTLTDVCFALISSVGESTAEQQIFFWDQREVGTYIGKSFRDSLFPVGPTNLKDQVKMSIDMIPQVAGIVFDKAMQTIENNPTLNQLPGR